MRSVRSINSGCSALPLATRLGKRGDGAVVAVRLAVMVGDDAARLLDDERGGGKVPFALARQRDGGVGPAARDEREPVGHRVHPFGLHLGPRLLPDLLLEQAAAGDEQRSVERALRACRDRLVVEEGAVPAHGVEELIGGGIEHRAEHRHAVLDQRGRDRPFRHVTQEGVGAVDRVDHPHPAALEPLVDRPRSPPTASHSPGAAREARA